MKNIKRFISMTVAVITLLWVMVPLYSCSFKEAPAMQTEYFKYCYINKAGSNVKTVNGEYVAVIGLTESGAKQEILVIPDSIDGKAVVQIGMSGLGWSESIENDSCKKIYLPKNLLNKQCGLSAFTKKICRFPLSDEYVIKHPVIYYIPENEYIKISDNVKKSGAIINIANVTYFSDDKTYWIDDCEEGETLFEPPAPENGGYTFEGWYTEPEFINKWNFATDTYHAQEDVISMKLYAHWMTI